MIGRPVALPGAILRDWPELAAVHWRRGGIPVRIAGWPLLQSHVAAITLWRTVFLAPDTTFAPELLLHELRHVHQFQASLAFPLLYLWESLRRGYHDNKYEADARAYAARRIRGTASSYA